jgi:superfamily I DNA/RNA helicase
MPTKKSTLSGNGPNPQNIKKASALAALTAKPKEPLQPHIIVQALAGTGKTTTLIEGLKILKGLESAITPSPQQQAIWDHLATSPANSSVAMVAFNTSIADELRSRMPVGCEAMTLHSLGNKAICSAYGRLKVEKNRVQEIICKITGKDIWELRRSKQVMLKATEDLVALCKQNLIGGEDPAFPGIEDLEQLVSYYDIDLNSSKTEVFDLVPKVLQWCLTPERDRCIDFNDMVWLPVAQNLTVPKYDLLLVDERQDMSKCQQALILMAGKRIIAVGDEHQSIYGFAGADAEACSNLKQLLEATGREVVELPLTVTRRCGKAIVAEAQRFVPEFEAYHTNPEGKVHHSTLALYQTLAQPGDMVLCRINAPLVSECFKFLKQNRKAVIAGRDVGQGLIKLIQKLEKAWHKQDMGGSTFYPITELITALGDWYKQETDKELAKRNPNDNKIQALDDNYSCLCCFCEEATTVAQVVQKIEAIFTDDKTDGIRLSSIHKSKGLEAQRIFILQLPFTIKAKSNWEAQQNANLEYVSITRAIEELCYVKMPNTKKKQGVK